MLTTEGATTIDLYYTLHYLLSTLSAETRASTTKKESRYSKKKRIYKLYQPTIRLELITWWLQINCTTFVLCRHVILQWEKKIINTIKRNIANPSVADNTCLQKHEFLFIDLYIFIKKRNDRPLVLVHSLLRFTHHCAYMPSLSTT